MKGGGWELINAQKILSCRLKGIENFQEFGIGGYNSKMYPERMGCGLCSCGSGDVSVTGASECDD
jgi:hypothetical protein